MPQCVWRTSSHLKGQLLYNYYGGLAAQAEYFPGSSFPHAGDTGSLLQADDLDAEVEGLRRYGVDLATGHADGYTFRGEHPAPTKPWDGTGSILEQLPTTALSKPWEGPGTVLEQLGPSKAVQCDSADGWNNEEFLFELREGIAYCTLNRPAANNSMTSGIIAGFHDAARILRGRSDVRLVILTGNGRMFCAGGDPKTFQEAQEVAQAKGAAPGTQAADGETLVNPGGAEISGYVASINPSIVDAFSRDLADWASLPQFTLCCLNGSAMGSGVGLACACDMVVAVKTAHITLSEVKLGIIPAAISPHVIRCVGASAAKRLFMTGENHTVQSAVEMGLVQRVVNDTSEFPKVVKEMAQKIQAIEPHALAMSKEAALGGLGRHTSEVLMVQAAETYARVRRGAACETGMKALSMKKKPDFMNRAIDVKEEHGEYIPDGPPPQVTLSREQAKAMENELIQRYSAEEFQAKLRKAFEAAGTDTVKQGRARQEVCLEVQKPVLRKFGFEASKRGVTMSVQAFQPFNGDPEIAERNNLLAWLVNPITQALTSRPSLSNP
mmetsp:Transcript_121889/g.379416  ORF Transcript_121889/g.379416 Transcript_121889/m.379416 type:complete len:553 (-) Transcript_121889:108-1766(-)